MRKRTHAANSSAAAEAEKKLSMQRIELKSRETSSAMMTNWKTMALTGVPVREATRAKRRGLRGAVSSTWSAVTWRGLHEGERGGNQGKSVVTEVTQWCRSWTKWYSVVLIGGIQW